MRAYVIPAGGSNALGAKGYVDCAAELGRQFSTERIRPDTILHATGSGGTRAGVIFGLHTAGIATQVRGISIAAPAMSSRKTPSLLGDTVVFLHTGGAHALHGYPADFSNPRRPNDEGKS